MTSEIVRVILFQRHSSFVKAYAPQDSGWRLPQKLSHDKNNFLHIYEGIFVGFNFKLYL